MVTGAGRGIGRAIALELGRQGAAVVLNYAQSAEGASEAVEEISAAGGRAIALQSDLASVHQSKAAVTAAVRAFGHLEILVNNAGVDPRVPFEEVTEELWDRILAINLKAAFFCSQAAVQEMKKAGKGRIINISSVHGEATMPQLAVYAASKGGMNAMTRQLALDLGVHKITVNAIAPGSVFVEKNTYAPAVRALEIPVGRVGRPEDISSVVAFLASDQTDWLTGQVITVDGGTTARVFLNLAAR